MNENDTITKEEWVEYIRESLDNNFDVKAIYLGDGLLAIDEHGGYISSEERYEHIDALGESMVEYLRENYDYDFDYEILHMDYELVIQVI